MKNVGRNAYFWQNDQKYFRKMYKKVKMIIARNVTKAIFEIYRAIIKMNMPLSSAILRFAIQFLMRITQIYQREVFT